MEILPEHMYDELMHFWKDFILIEKINSVINSELKLSATLNNGEKIEFTDYHKFVKDQFQNNYWKSVAPFLNIKQQKKLENVYFAIVPSTEFNGKVFKLGDNAIIGISSILSTLSLSNKFIMDAYILYEKIHKKLTDNIRPTDDEFGLLFDELFKIESLTKQLTDGTFFSEYSKKEVNKISRIHQLINLDQEIFVFLHELGHILLGHTDNLKFKKNSTQEINYIPQSHQNELNADKFAFDLMSKMNKHIILPISLLFSFLRFVEERKVFSAPMGTPMNQIQVFDSHPPFDKRFKFLTKEFELDHSLYFNYSQMLKSQIKENNV